MKIYSNFGINDFIICLGYKGYVIKEYFFNYYRHMSDITVDLTNDSVEVHRNYADPWKITLVDTGELTMTGGRLSRIKQYLHGEKSFCLTYGDGIADINISELVKYHEKHGKLATVTAVKPAGRFGSLEIANGRVNKFQEKPRGDGAYVNGGFFVLSSGVFDYIADKESLVFERQPLNDLSSDGELMSFKHEGFWHAIDTLRDKNYADELWQAGSPPWRTWE